MPWSRTGQPHLVLSVADTTSFPPPGRCWERCPQQPLPHSLQPTLVKGATGLGKENLQPLGESGVTYNAHTPEQAFFNTPEMCHQSPTQLKKMQRDLRAHLAPTHKTALNPQRESVHEFGCRRPKRAFQPESRQQYSEELSGDVGCWVVFLYSFLRAHGVGCLCSPANMELPCDNSPIHS